MTKQLLSWKPVVCRNIRNRNFNSSLPNIISSYYEGKLLFKIMAMPRKNPISFENAVRLVNERQIDAMTRMNAKECNWYYGNFVQFVSESGFHIDLTGDEFVFHLSQVREN